VVVLYVLNDPDHAVYGMSSGQVANYYDRPPSYLVDWLEGSVYKIRENQRQSSCPQPWANFIYCAHEGEVRESFRRMGEISRHGNVPFLVAIHPFLTAPLEGAGYPYADLHGKLATLARENGMEAIDLREAYRGHEVSDVQQDPDDPLHPNALGHELVGTYLAHAIAARADLR
jgi:hypothetical protein